MTLTKTNIAYNRDLVATTNADSVSMMHCLMSRRSTHAHSAVFAWFVDEAHARTINPILATVIPKVSMVL